MKNDKMKLNSEKILNIKKIFRKKNENDKNKEDFSEVISIPSFQRNFIWKEKQQQFLLETIFLGMQIPPLVFKKTQDEDKKDSYEVVDGQQRLTTIIRFMDNEFNIKWSSYTKNFYSIENNKKHSKEINEIIKDTEGKYFEELLPKYKNPFNNYRLYYWEIEDNFEEIDYFKRINDNSIKLNPQEIREAVFSSSNFIEITDYILNILEDEKNSNDKTFFVKNKILSSTAIGRKSDNELILIIFGYEFKKKIDDNVSSLDSYMEGIITISEIELKKFLKNLTTPLEDVKKIYKGLNKEGNSKEWYSGKYYFLLIFILININLNKNFFPDLNKLFDDFIELYFNDEKVLKHDLLIENLKKFYIEIKNDSIKTKKFIPIHTKSTKAKETSLKYLLDKLIFYSKENK